MQIIVELVRQPFEDPLVWFGGGLLAVLLLLLSVYVLLFVATLIWDWLFPLKKENKQKFKHPYDRP